ncbi:hypothetical protein ACHAPF_002283 [Botrytis cinerea]
MLYKNFSKESCYHGAALPLVSSFTQSAKLPLAHKNPERVDMIQHPKRDFSLSDPANLFAEDAEWFSCRTFKGAYKDWKLDVQPDYKFHEKHLERELGCIFHHVKSGHPPRLILVDFKEEIPGGYVKILDDEVGLYAQFDRKAPIKIRYEMTRELVLREHRSNRHSIIGQAIVVGRCVASSATIGPWFDLQLDVRDALNLTIPWAQCPAYQKKIFL